MFEAKQSGRSRMGHKAIWNTTPWTKCSGDKAVARQNTFRACGRRQVDTALELEMGNDGSMHKVMRTQQGTLSQV